MTENDQADRDGVLLRSVSHNVTVPAGQSVELSLADDLQGAASYKVYLDTGEQELSSQELAPGKQSNALFLVGVVLVGRGGRRPASVALFPPRTLLDRSVLATPSRTV